jgi:hypothetical protein
VEIHLGHLREDEVKGLDAGEDLGLGGLKDAVEAAQLVARASAKWVPRSA